MTWQRFFEHAAVCVVSRGVALCGSGQAEAVVAAEHAEYLKFYRTRNHRSNLQLAR